MKVICVWDGWKSKKKKGFKKHHYRVKVARMFRETVESSFHSCQRFSAGNNLAFPSRGHLTMSRETFDCPDQYDAFNL